MNQSKKITEGALYSAVFFVFMLINLFVPGAALFMPFILPIPFIIYAQKYDWKPSLLMFAVTLLMSFVILPMFSIPTTVLAASGGIVIGSYMHRKRTAYETLVSGTGGYIVGLIFIFLFTQLALDINWAAEIDLVLKESIQTSQQLMNQLGMGEQASENIKLLEETIEIMKDLIPVGIALSAIVMGFLSQWLAYKVLNRIEQTTYQFPAFRHLTFPISILWIYFISLVAILLMSDMDSFVFIVANNVQSLIRMLMMIQGLSFIFFYSYSKNWSKSIPIVITIMTFILPFIFFYIVGLLGLIDLGFGLRDRISSKEDKK